MRAILIIFSLLLIEGTFRATHHWIYPLYDDKISTIVEHPEFHHWHIPNSTHVYRAATGEFSVLNRTNSFGMAGKEVSLYKPRGVSRIVLLGDSFVEGFYTEEEESIVDNLQQLLNQVSEPKYEVLNFGCRSFSPSVEYFSLLHLAQKFQPDMVIIMFHMTDVTNDWKYTMKSRLAVNANGEVIGIDGREDKSFLYKFAEKSAALRAIVQRARQLLQYQQIQEADDLTTTYDAMFKTSYNQKDNEAWLVSNARFAHF
jgi:hypothetical protein